jgi:hypothetical protein
MKKNSPVSPEAGPALLAGIDSILAPPPGGGRRPLTVRLGASRSDRRALVAALVAARSGPVARYQSTAQSTAPSAAPSAAPWSAAPSTVPSTPLASAPHEMQQQQQQQEQQQRRWRVQVSARLRRRAGVLLGVQRGALTVGARAVPPALGVRWIAHGDPAGGAHVPMPPAGAVPPPGLLRIAMGASAAAAAQSFVGQPAPNRVQASGWLALARVFGLGSSSPPHRSVRATAAAQLTTMHRGGLHGLAGVRLENASSAAALYGTTASAIGFAWMRAACGTNAAVAARLEIAAPDHGSAPAVSVGGPSVAGELGGVARLDRAGRRTVRVVARWIAATGNSGARREQLSLECTVTQMIRTRTFLSVWCAARGGGHIHHHTPKLSFGVALTVRDLGLSNVL